MQSSLSLSQQKSEAAKELALRELEKRHEDKREDLIEFIRFFFENEKNEVFQHNWHHDVIAEKLKKVLSGEITRLMINIPPGHMKTELVTKCFPVWAMGKDPTREFLATGYSTSLTQTYSSQARDYYQSETFRQIFPRVPKLRDDQNTKEWWVNEQGGGYYATGTTGSITGRRFSCVAGDTLISTNNGIKKIEDVAQSWDSLKVLSYNHEKKRPEYRSIQAFKKTEGRKVYKLVTSGGACIKATREHRFYTLERGYVTLDEIKVGDTLVTYGYNNKVCSVPEECCKKSIRNKKGLQAWKEKFFLYTQLFLKALKRQKEKDVPKVWGGKRKTNTKNVSFLQRDNFKRKKRGEEEKLRAMLKNVLSCLKKKYVLLKRLCKQSALKKDDGRGELAPQRWNELCKMLQRNAKNYFQKGPKMLCSLWERRQENKGGSTKMGESSNKNCSCCSSYRRRPNKQYARKPDTYLSEMSYETSQVKEDTVSMVREIRNSSVDVYDIQVEGTSNFFANKILVHNCIIIDDPLKPDEGESSVKRKSVNNWYENTVLSRLYNPLKDAVIIIMQRVHDADLCGYLQSKMKDGTGEDWEVLSLPAIADRTDKYRKVGEALHVDRYPIEALEKLKKSYGSINFSCQYQQDPISDEIREFKKEWIKYWGNGDGEKALPAKMKVRIIVDLASSSDTRSDENAILVVGEDVRRDRYILASWGDWLTENKRCNPEEVIEKIYFYADTYADLDPHLSINIETVSYQRTLMYWLKEYGRKRQGKIYRINEIKTPTSKSKEDKIRGLIPFFSNEMIYFPERGCEELIQQIMRFPKGDRVDRLDTLAMELDLEKRPSARMSMPKVQFDPRSGRVLKYN